MTPLTADLDRYYAHLKGDVKTAAKPCLAVTPDVRTLISQIERSGQQGFSELATFILGMDTNTQRIVSSRWSHMLSTFQSSGRDTDFSLSLKQGSGITLWVGNNLEVKTMWRLDQVCLLHKYETKSPVWFFLGAIDGLRLKVKVHDKPWQLDPEMELHLAEFRDARRWRGLESPKATKRRRRK